MSSVFFSSLSTLSDFVGKTKEIDGYCCSVRDSICKPTGIGGSSRIVGCGIDDGIGGMITEI